MRIAKLKFLLPAVFAALLISSCKNANKNCCLKEYSSNDALFIEAMNIAKTDNPNFFLKISNHKLDENLKGLQILGKNGECVYIYNDSSIIIEEDLSLYCFDKKTGNLIAKI